MTPAVTRAAAMRVLSLGAGVQSSTLALMASCGEIEPPDCAIFADTGWEPKAVYAWLDWLEKQLTYPLHRVSVGNLRRDLLAASNSTGQRFAAVPFYTGSGGMGRRQCTREYKIEPITRKIRELGGSPKNPAELWIGISQDEMRRMKPNRTTWIHNRWPLIERRMNRQDCLAWLQAHGFPRAPKSSCLGCPYHKDEFWRALKDSSPDEWADTVAVDKAIRKQPGFRQEQFMHRDLVPLDRVDLSHESDWGQEELFDQECEGMCDV